MEEKEIAISEQKINLETKQSTLAFLEKENAITTEQYEAAIAKFEEKQLEVTEFKKEVVVLKEQATVTSSSLATFEAKNKGSFYDFLNMPYQS